MNSSTIDSGDHTSTIDNGHAQLHPPFSGRDGTRELDTRGLLEDIDEPEAWTLASFSDLLPHEVA